MFHPKAEVIAIHRETMKKKERIQKDKFEKSAEDINSKTAGKFTPKKRQR